jgi:hypothetical protein
MWIEFWTADILTPASVAVLFAAAFFVLGDPRVSADPARSSPTGSTDRADGASDARSREFYAAVAIGLGGAAWGSRLHEGGWFNVLRPGFAALAILFGLGAHAARRAVQVHGNELRTRLTGLIYLAIAIQLLRLAYNPFQEIPSRADRETGDRVVATLSRAPGDVFVPDHPYLAIRAGKGSTAHRAALDDILRVGDERAEQFRTDLIEQIAERRFVAALVGNSAFVPLLGEGFRRERELIEDETFFPVVGMKMRPNFLFVREEGPR